MLSIGALKSLGTRLAKETGYPAPARRAINTVSRGSQLAFADDAIVERGVDLDGEITLRPKTKVCRGTLLDGTITIADEARVGPNSWIDGDVTVGQGTNLTEAIEVLAARGDEIRIGKYNAIARRTTFQNRYHVTNKAGMQAKLYQEKVGSSLEERAKGPIVVGSDVWIGLNTVVLSGVTIGHGAVIGAGAVVTKDIPPYSVVGGVPAEHIKWRFDEPTRDQLLDIEWWDWSDEKIRRNADFFDADLQDCGDLQRLIR